MTTYNISSMLSSTTLFLMTPVTEKETKTLSHLNNVFLPIR